VVRPTPIQEPSSVVSTPPPDRPPTRPDRRAERPAQRSRGDAQRRRAGNRSSQPFQFGL